MINPWNKIQYFTLLGILAFYIRAHASDISKTRCASVDKKAYLFYYFEGYAGERAGLFLAYSHDLHTWKKVADSLISPSMGEYKVFRDPCVARTSDGIFHLVWTTGRSGFGYARSEDGLHWGNEKFIVVGGRDHPFEFANVWAPELYTENDTTYIIWSSTLKKDYVPPVDSAKWWTSTWNHRFYYTATTDFNTFTPTRPFWNPGFNAIDAAIHKSDSAYYLFFKDERRPTKQIVMAKSQSLTGPYTDLQPLAYSLTEGAIPVPNDTTFVLYYDYYHEYNGYRYITSTNMKNWSPERMPVKEGFSDIIRHGSIIEVSETDLNKILNNNK